MRLLYAGFQIADRGAARFAPSRVALLNAAGVVHGYACQWDCDSLALAVTPATATTKLLQVEAALRNQEGDLEFLYPDGSPTGKQALSALTLSGVRCVSGPNWSRRPGAQHWTWLEYGASFYWEEVHPSLLVDPDRWLTDFTETVSVRGGTPRLVLHEPINALPVVQTTIPQQGWTVTQRGQAVGRAGYPVPVPPFWPANLADKVVERGSPVRVGRNYRDFPVAWEYQFVFGGAVEPLALPSVWAGYPALPVAPTVP